MADKKSTPIHQLPTPRQHKKSDTQSALVAVDTTVTMVLTNEIPGSLQQGLKPCTMVFIQTMFLYPPPTDKGVAEECL